MQPSGMRAGARGLALLWAGFWIFFAIASSMADRKGMPGLPAILFVLILLGSVGTAWKWEVPGGALLVLEGLLVVGAYACGYLHASHVSTIVFVLLTLATPPFIAGLLLIRSGWKTRPFGTA